MKSGNAITSLILVILLGGFLQLILIKVDTQDTPARVVAEFSKAYFELDRSMADWLCSDIRDDAEADVVGQYLDSAAKEAESLGYNISYMRTQLFQVATFVISKDDDSAEVRIIAKRKRLINPIFTLLAKLFYIGQEYHLDEIISVVKEDDKWKICGQPYALNI